MSLFTGSLEKRNRKYLKDVKLQDLNNQYQKAQNDIIRELDLGLISKAETANKLIEMQNTLIESTTNKLIPLSRTNAPEVIKPKEESKPMTASEYENKAREKIKREQPLKNLLQQIKEKKLKSTPKKEEKVSIKTPFQQELEEKLKSRSSQATTASTTSIFDDMPEKEYNKHVAKYSSDFRKEYEAKTGKKYPYMGNIGYETMRNTRALWGQGIRKKRK